MEAADVRTIDDLGRLVIPKKIRDIKGWDKGTRVAVCILNDLVVLVESKQPEDHEGEVIDTQIITLQ